MREVSALEAELVDPLLVVDGEDGAAPLLVDALHDPDDLPALVLDRQAEDLPRAVACRLVDLLVEAGLAIGVGDVEPLPGRRDGTDDALRPRRECEEHVPHA